MSVRAGFRLANRLRGSLEAQFVECPVRGRTKEAKNLNYVIRQQAKPEREIPPWYTPALREMPRD